MMRRIFLALALVCPTWTAFGQSALTVVSDTLTSPNGTHPSGTMTLSWQRTLNDANPRGIIYAGNTTLAITNGVINVSLFPNTAMLPVSTCYTVSYKLGSGGNSIAYWYVPVSASPVNLQQIQGQVPCPTQQGAIVAPGQITPGGAGLTQVLTSDPTGFVSWRTGGGGGGGTPGGSTGQVQYNNSGAFGGFTFAGDCTFSVPNITCTKTGGVPFAASATINATNAANISSGTLAGARLPAINLAVGGAGGVTGNLSVANLNNGSGASASTYWTGNNTWSALPAINLAASGSGGVTGNLGVSNLNGGSGASASTAWFGDGTWKSVSGAGTVTHVSGPLTLNQLVIGNGTGDVNVLGTLGTTTTVLHGNASGAPSFGAVNLAADVSGVTPFANGGLGTNANFANHTFFGNNSGGTAAPVVTQPTFADLAAGQVSANAKFLGGNLFVAGVNPQSGTSYTIQALDEDKLVTFNNGASVAVTLPQATTTGFTEGAFFNVFNRGAGSVTITPTTSTINGAATLVLGQNQGAYIVSDGTNYSALAPGLAACPACVTSAASLTSTAIMTGAGLQASQTPSATTTLDLSGNISTPGTMSTGVGGSVAGSDDMGAGTAASVPANSFGWGAPSVMTTSVRLTSPNALPAANQIMVFPAPTSNVSSWAWTTLNFAAVAGSATCAQMPALTGDATSGAGSCATTLANTAVSPATYGDSTHVGQFTVDAKGRLTAASNVAIAGATNNLCTDQPAPGAWAPTWTAGHTYCLSAGTYTVAAAQNVSVNNVTVIALSQGAIIQRTNTATDLFDASGTNFKLRGVTIDGNGGTGKLIASTGDGFTIEGCVFQNVSTNGANGLINVLIGNHIRIVGNRFPSNPDMSILLQSDTGAITDFHVEDNVADFASTTSTSAIRINQTAFGLSDGTIAGNAVTLNAGGGTAEYCISTAGTANERISITDNSCLANSGVQGAYFLFGFKRSTFRGNKFDLNNQFAGASAVNMGDCYGSTIANNTLKLTSPNTGGQSGILLLDGNGCNFNGNTLTDMRANASNGIVVGTSVAATNQMNIVNNQILYVAGGGGSAGAIGIKVNCAASVDCSNYTIANNTISGTSNASSVGISVLRSAGTVSKYGIYANNIDGMVTGISLPASATNMAVGPNSITTVTTRFSAAAGSLDATEMPTVFANLTACAASLEGNKAAVTDSTTATWGNTVTGSSTNHVYAYCDGTNWTVMGK